MNNLSTLALRGMAIAMIFCFETEAGYSPALAEMENAGCHGPLLGAAFEVYGPSHEEIFLAFKQDRLMFAIQVNSVLKEAGLEDRMPEVMA